MRSAIIAAVKRLPIPVQNVVFRAARAYYRTVAVYPFLSIGRPIRWVYRPIRLAFRAMRRVYVFARNPIGPIYAFIRDPIGSTRRLQRPARRLRGKFLIWRARRALADSLIKARAFQKQGEHRAALDAIERPIEKHAAYAALLPDCADIYFEAKAPDRLLERMKAVLLGCEFGPDWMLVFARAALRAGNSALAIETVRDFLRLNPYSLIELCAFAHLLREEGCDKECIAVFKQIRLAAQVLRWPLRERASYAAVACEYAGYAAEAEQWTAEYEAYREVLCDDKFGKDQRTRPIDLGRLASSLGDLASRFDGMIKLRALGLMEERPSPVYMPTGQRVANEALVALIGEHVELNRSAADRVAAKDAYFWPAWRDNERFSLLDGRSVHNTYGCALAEVEWQRQGREPVLRISADMIAAGRRKLGERGFGDRDWFAAVHVREPGYYNETTDGLHNSSLHRCAEVASYEPAIRWILDQGGWVVRLGDATMAPLSIRHERLIDYAHADWREDWLDLFFLSEARYLLATNSGPMCLASALGTVVGIANYVPMAMPPLSPRNLFIPKLLHVDAEGRDLTFKEMLSPPFRMANRSHLFRLFASELGVSLRDNSAEDILAFVRDLHAFAEADGKAKFTQHDHLEKIFDEMDCRYIAQIAPSFLDRHAECLAPALDMRFIQAWDRLGEDWRAIDATLLRGPALERLSQNDWRGALVLFQGMYAAGMRDGTLMYGLGWALCRAGRITEAREALTRAVELAPDSGAPVRELAGLLRQTGDYAVAIDLYRKYLARSPNGLSDWLDYGHVLCEAGRLDEANSAYNRVMYLVDVRGVDPQGQEGFLAAACTYAGRHAEARAWTAAFEKRRDDDSGAVLRNAPLVISLGRLNSRIGDVASRFDLLKKGMILGMLDLPSENIVIDATGDYVNSPFVNLWRHHLPFSTPENAQAVRGAPWLQRRDLENIRLRDGRTLYYPVAYSLIEAEWIRQDRKPIISLSEEQIAAGWMGLEKAGIKRGDWFVALHVREAGFFNEAEIGPNSDHHHRSARIEPYQKAIDWIIAQGGWVVRIGDPSMTPLAPRKGLLDYPFSDLRSPEMDIFLMSQCRYLIGTNSGPMAVATSFGVVCGITNYMPIGLPLCSPRNLMLPKMLFLRRENRFLTLQEMMSPPLGSANRYHLYRRFMSMFDAELRENTPEELLDFVQDLHVWAESDFKLDDARHDQVREIIERSGEVYVSPFAKSWLDRYGALGCLEISSNDDPFGQDATAVAAVIVDEPPTIVEPPPPILREFSIEEIVADVNAGIAKSLPRRVLKMAAGPLLDVGMDARQMATVAEELEKAGAYMLALRSLICAHRQAENDVPILDRMATLAAFMGRLELAIWAYRRCLMLDPADLRRYELLGAILLRTGDAAGARDAYERSVPLKPVQGYHGMGIAAEGLGDHEGAVRFFTRVLEHAPASVSTLKALLRVADAAGDHGAAQFALDALRTLQPGDASLAAREPASADGNVADAAPEDAPALGDMFGKTPAESYVDLLSRAICNFTNLESDIRLYKFAAAAGQGTLDAAEAGRLLSDDAAELTRYAAARWDGRWVYNDRYEYATTTTKTMVGLRRLRNIHDCVRDVVKRDIPGDLVECGVWRGGSAILMRGVLHAYGDRKRHVWLCDSFEGLPEVDFQFEREVFGQYLDWVAVDEGKVRRNFSTFGLLDDRVHFVKGWFEKTLHKAPIGPISVLRLDGDYYTSTMDILVGLYDRVSPGGYIIVDDYYSVGTCAEAVHAFLDRRKIPAPEMHRIDGHSLYWRKDRI